MTDITERLRGSTLEAARRLINGAFRRDGENLHPDRRPRFSIPCRPDHDDDTTVIRDIGEAADTIDRLRAALRFYANWPQGPAGNIAPLLFDAGHTARAALKETSHDH